jgi:NAD-dependent dihydropyrimidine dehydrogenase PreA subunit
MPYLINDNCDKCGLCAFHCPVDCIDEGAQRFIINSSCCVDCGACREVCPLEAVERDGGSERAA